MTTARDASLTRPWRKSSRSTGGQDCVEVAQTVASCLVRDSKDPHGISLAVSRQAWASFTRRLSDRAPGA
jgi:hypothetical protein